MVVVSVVILLGFGFSLSSSLGSFPLLTHRILQPGPWDFPSPCSDAASQEGFCCWVFGFATSLVTEMKTGCREGATVCGGEDRARHKANKTALSEFIPQPKSEPEITWQMLEPAWPQAGCRERCDPLLQVSPPVSSQTISIFKYPISVAKMCFLTCMGARRCGRGARWPWRWGCSGPRSRSGGPRDGVGVLMCMGGLGGRGVGAPGGFREGEWRKVPVEESGAVGCPWVGFQKL